MIDVVRKFDWLLFGAMMSLIAAGMISLWSLSPDQLFPRQALWAGIGLALVFVFAIIDYRLFRNHARVVLGMLIFAVLLLLALRIFGTEIRGAASWFRFGGVAFEPVEPVKLILILILAKYWAGRHVEIEQIRHLVVSGLYVLVPAALVALQPDLGSATILILLWGIMAIFSGIRIRHFAFLAGILILTAAISWVFLLAPYQKERVTSFLDPYRDSQGAGYNAIQAMVAVGSGGILGKGMGYGTQSHLNFLPEAETDFIFAAFAEEAGFAGVFVLIFLFSFLLWRMLYTGLGAKDNFSKLYVLGFSALLFFQFMIHAGINVGLLPVTGITLPFVSYGGSSLVTLMVGMGILQSIRIHSRSDLAENQI